MEVRVWGLEEDGLGVGEWLLVGFETVMVLSAQGTFVESVVLTWFRVEG